MAGCGSEMQNATRCHLVCIRIPKEQEREMIFDLHQRLLSNQTNKNSLLGSKTMDSSLHTNIPQEEGTEIACKAYDSFPKYNPPIPTRFLRYMLGLILNENSFKFNGENYLQTHGTAMGTKMALSFANIFMAESETTLIQQNETKPKEWKRYIDDIFSLWDSDKRDVDKFIEQANKYHPTIKFTAEISENEITFLHRMVFKGERLKKNPFWTSKLTTNLLKPFNIHISTHAIHPA